MSNQMVKVLAVNGLLPDPEDLTRLKTDFKEYKEGKRLPTYFGRDGDFSRHHGAKFSQLRHLHLAESGTWPPQKRQYDRTSDRWLIYCPGFWQDHIYLLIAVLEPHAHVQANRTDLINGLVRIAEDFRNKF